MNFSEEEAAAIKEIVHRIIIAAMIIGFTYMWWRLLCLP